MIIDTSEINGVLLPRLLTLVTCEDGIGGTDAMPLDNIMPVSSNPSMLVVVMDPAAKTFQNILQQREFVVNVLSRDFAEKVVACSETYPRGISKLEEVGLKEQSSSRVGAKRVGEAKLWVECKLVNKMKVGENEMIFGEVLYIEADDTVISDGKMDVMKLNPLIRISKSGPGGVGS